MTGSLLLVVIGAVFLFALGFLVTLAKFYRKIEQGKALIVNSMRAEPEVTFTSRVVIPILHKAEVMDISVKTIEIDRRGKEGLICRDNIRADIKVTFFVRVNKTREDVIKVAQAISCVHASDQKTLEELFSAKFSEALKTVGKQLEFVDLYTKRDEFRDQIVQVIGGDLNGYVLEDAAIDFPEQTPLSHLDENNILDTQGIRKVTELTAIEKKPLLTSSEFSGYSLGKFQFGTATGRPPTAPLGSSPPSGAVLRLSRSTRGASMRWIGKKVNRRSRLISVAAIQSRLKAARRGREQGTCESNRQGSKERHPVTASRSNKLVRWARQNQGYVVHPLPAQLWRHG